MGTNIHGLFKRETLCNDEQVFNLLPNIVVWCLFKYIIKVSNSNQVGSRGLQHYYAINLTHLNTNFIAHLSTFVHRSCLGWQRRLPLVVKNKGRVLRVYFSKCQQALEVILILYGQSYLTSTRSHELLPCPKCSVVRDDFWG